MNNIATERLLLRPARIDDCYELYNVLSQPETTWWADLPLYGNCCEVIDFIMWGNHSLGFRQYMITDKKTDHILGLLQVMGPLFSGDEPGVIRLGYLLSEEERGKGYMTEAVRAVIDQLFSDPYITELYLEILPNNKPSQGVAKRCGFQFMKQAEEERSVRNLDMAPLDRYLLTRECYNGLLSVS